MTQTKCGFDNLPNGRAGADLLVTLGPTLFVDIGFDPILDFIQYGRFTGVDLAAGGQVHKALIGRTFLQYFTMVYVGKTGSVELSST